MAPSFHSQVNTHSYSDITRGKEGKGRRNDGVRRRIISFFDSLRRNDAIHRQTQPISKSISTRQASLQSQDPFTITSRSLQPYCLLSITPFIPSLSSLLPYGMKTHNKEARRTIIKQEKRRTPPFTQIDPRYSITATTVQRCNGLRERLPIGHKLEKGHRQMGRAL